MYGEPLYKVLLRHRSRVTQLQFGPPGENYSVHTCPLRTTKQQKLVFRARAMQAATITVCRVPAKRVHPWSARLAYPAGNIDLVAGFRLIVVADSAATGRTSASLPERWFLVPVRGRSGVLSIRTRVFMEKVPPAQSAVRSLPCPRAGAGPEPHQLPGPHQRGHDQLHRHRAIPLRADQQ